MFLRNRGFKGRHKIQDVWSSVPHVVTKRPDPSGNVYMVTPLDGNGQIKTLQRRDLLDARRLVPDQLCEAPHEEKRDEEDDQHVEDNDDDTLYRVITLTPQLRKEHALPFNAAPPTAETAGEHDEMAPAAPYEFDEIQPEIIIEGPGNANNLDEQQDSGQEPRRSQRVGAGCHSNPHRELRSAAMQQELRLTEVSSEMLANFCESQLLLARLMASAITKSN